MQDQHINLGNFYLEHSNQNETAIIFKEEKISYKDLDKKINQYSSYLKRLGVKKGEAVVLSSQNSPEFIYSYFGVIKLGAKVVPLNLTLTLEEIKFIVADSSAKTLIIHSFILSKLNLTKDQIKVGLNLNEVVVINDETRDQINQTEILDLPALQTNDVCTLLYTSGTTGKPKGVMLTHENLLSNTVATQKSIEVVNKDVFLNVLPFFHTFGFTVTVLTPLFAGASMVIHETFQPKEVIEALNEYDVTVFSGVPSMYIVLAHLLKKERLTFNSLRVAVSGGAPLPVEILNLFNQEYRIPLVEGYGLTEASPVVTFNPLDGPKKPGSIGKAIDGVEVKIHNAENEDVSVGEVGEILVKGSNVMKGYLNLSEDTDKTLVNGWLHTGDLGYMDQDGYIFIVDRKKDLIITGGLNVYPREVEEVLYQHPNVLEVAVIGVEDSLRGEVVKAYVVPKEGTAITKVELITFLKEKLATYKIPKVVEFKESLPKNATGKILKKELR